MSTRGEELAKQFEDANAEFIRFVGTLTPQQWSAKCPGEGWSVGVVAHHIAEDHGILSDLVKTIAAGGNVPPLTAEFINSLNADHSVRAVDCTRAETIEVAESRGTEAARMLRGLSEQELSKTAVVPVLGGEVTAERLSEWLLIGHIGMHVPSIEEAISKQG